MNGELFLDSIAAKLGRSRGSAPRERSDRRSEAAHHAASLELDARSLADQFQSELERVGGIAVRCGSAREVEDRLLALIADTKADSLVSWSRAELASWNLERVWRTGTCASWEGGGDDERARFRDRAARAHIGITGADLAIAETGSLVLCSSADRPRSVSLLPAMHVALLRADRVVAHTGEALDALARRDVPSSLLVITGPSRTSDIENDLTIGVHGPAAVVVLILDAGGSERARA